MDFAYTPELEELKRRAAGLTTTLMAYEDECERDGSLTPERLAEIRAAVLDARLNAINMPVEWGGAGLSVLEQVVVQEELGRLTNALWDAVWRPANPFRACTRGAARALARAGHPRRAPRRGRDHRGARRLGPERHRHDRDAGRRRLASSTASSGSSPSATSPTTCSCSRSSSRRARRRCSSSTRTCPASSSGARRPTRTRSSSSTRSSASRACASGRSRCSARSAAATS